MENSNTIKSNESNEINESNESNESNEINESNESNESNEINESNESNEINESEPIEQKKTRGRKKKIQNENEKDDLELLQIEQVKKKRGRKKKWEVETTTKLIENSSISFSENPHKEEPVEIDDNYEAQNILFGNLNIKIHSNKETVHVDDIKQSLKKNNDSLCKINLTNSDYDDSDEESNNLFIRNTDNKSLKIKNKKKEEIIEKNMKIMKFFTNEFDVGNEILISPIRCYQCHHNFNNKPFFLPIDYNCELNRFKVTGNFCSPNCVKTYAINSKIYQNRLYLIGHMYRTLFGANYKIKPAPPIQCLKEYGGKLTIEEYRSTFDNLKQYSLKNICSKISMDEIIKN
jgi:hypothetical protein